MMNEQTVLPSNRKRKLDQVFTLAEWCAQEHWKEAIERSISHPEEALEHQGNDSPLALACRLGAPAECIQALLEASSQPVRRLIQSRGTPLHEAIVCEHNNVESSRVIQLLLEADEKLEGKSACLLQDVDGNTPLHLLIRRKFHLNIENDDNGTWFQMLQLLVKRAPEAVGIPDRGEYNETPLIMALKANTYVGNYPEGIIERRIREAVACMLQHCPEAARKTLEGARGSYAALHSAVFHGRCSDTIRLLLDAEQEACNTSRASLIPNAQGELPLHFAAMRGEPPRSTALLANANPEAVLTRDQTGLTPFHWMWIRFVSTFLALENERGETTVEARPKRIASGNKFTDFASLERGDFYSDLEMIRRLDPPVDFLQMRHTSPELLGAESDAWTDRILSVLTSTRQRYVEENTRTEQRNNIVWTRREAVTSFFWTKVVALLKAAASAMNADSRRFSLVHAALACPSCPPPVAQIICSLFPEELAVLDPSTGRLPLHIAASRSWHSWDWPRPDAEAEQTRTSEPAGALLLRGETIAVLNTAINASPPEAARVTDGQGRLALHQAIDSFVRACSNSGQSYMVDAHEPPVKSMLEALQQLVRSYPASLERRDGKTKLYPFLQATAAATEYRTPSSPNTPFPDEMPLSMVYLLLRENPSLLNK